MEIIECAKGGLAKRAAAHRAERAAFSLFDSFILMRVSLNGSLVKLCMLIEALQIVALSFFSKGSQQLVNTTLGTSLQYLADALLLFPYLPSDFSTVFIVNCVILGFLAGAIFLCSLPLFFPHLKGIKQPCFHASFYILTLSSSLLYLPFLGVCIMSFRCIDLDGKQTMKIDSSVICPNSQLYIAMATVSACCVFLLILIAAVYKLFIFAHEPSLHSVDGKAGPAYEVCTMLVRTVELLLILLLSTEEGENQQTFAFVEGAALAIVLILNLRLCVMYNRTAEQIRRFVSCLGAWVGVIEMLKQFVDTFAAASLGGVIFCGLLVEYLVLNSDSPSSALESLTTISHKRLTERTATRRLVCALDLYHRCFLGGRASDSLVSCYLRAHADRCENVICPVKSLLTAKELSPEKHRGKVLAALMYCINKMFKGVLLSHPDFLGVRLLYVGFLANYMQNCILAWEINEGTRTGKTNAIHRLHIYRYKKQLEEVIRAAKCQTQESYDSVEPLDITLRLRKSEKASRLIEQNAVAYGQFWDTLIDRSPSFERFVALGSSFLKTNERIKALWIDLTQARGMVPVRLVALYSSYSEEILQDEKKAADAKEYMEQPELLIQADVIFQHMGAGNSVVAVSADEKEMGHIKSFNAALCELTGYTRDELRNAHMLKLVPPLYQAMHVPTLAKKCAVMNSGIQVGWLAKETFVLHKSQYIVPVLFQLVATPNYTNGYCFLAILKKLAYKEEVRGEVYHIVTDKEKIISGATANLYELFGSDINLIRASAMNVDLFFPEVSSMGTPKEGVPFKTVLYLPSGGSCMFRVFSSTSVLPISPCSSPTPSIIPMRKSELEVVCEFRKITTADTGFLGYHYKFTKCVPHGENDTDSNDSLLPNIHVNGESPQKSQPEFALSYDSCAFFQRWPGSPGFDVALPTICSSPTSVGPRKDRGTEPMTQKRLPRFYQQLLPQARRIREVAGDPSFVEWILARPNFETGVEVWRIGGRGFVRAETNVSAYPSVDIDLEVLDADESDPEQKKQKKSGLATKNEFLMKSAIKNKGNLKKLVRSMPMPWVFVQLLLACTFVMLVGVASILAIYFIFSDLFTNLTEQIHVVYYVMDLSQCMLYSSSIGQQLILVNEGLLLPENAYPAYATADELFSWTTATMLSKLDELRNVMQMIESSQYESLTHKIYDQLTSYYCNGTNVLYTGIPLMLSAALLSQEVFQISHYKKASQFSYNDPAFATLYYNIKNDMQENTNVVINSFMTEMKNLYNEQSRNAKIVVIVLCCILGVLIWLQAPMAYWVNRTVDSQVDIFLKMPSRVCAKMERLANRFVIKVQNSAADAKDILDTSQDRGDGSAGENNAKNQQTRAEEGRIVNTLRDERTRKRDKRFYTSVWAKLSFIWRVAITFAVPAAAIIMMCVTAFDHYSFIYDMLELTNYTIRVDSLIVANQDLIRGYFYDGTMPACNTYVSGVLAFYYNEYQVDMMQRMHTLMEVNSRFVDSNKEYVNFIRRSMCIPGGDSAFCSDAVAAKGYLAVLSDIVWLTRYLLLNYNDRLKKYVYNTEQYKRTVRLYAQFVRPGALYIYGQILKEIESGTSSTMRILLAGVGIMVGFSVVFMGLIWLPYVSLKKKQLIQLRMLIMFIPPNAISKVKVLREFFTNILFRQDL